jgi:hypothetical protein
MISPAKTVKQYLAALPDDRRRVVVAVLEAIRAGLDPAYEEGIDYGAIGYVVPLRLYPAGYHTNGKPLPFVGLASQKQYISLYLMGTYCGCGDHSRAETPESKWFRQAWLKTGKKLDMGKSCIRFKRLEDVPLEVVTEAIRRVPVKSYIKSYEAMLDRTGKGACKPAARAVVRKKAAAAR